MARPRKEPDRDMNEIMSDIMTPLVAAYLHPEGVEDPNGHARLSDLCEKFKVSNLKAKKLLVTAGVYQSATLTKVNGEYVDIATEVMKLYKQGKSEADIMKVLHISRSTVNSLIPYSQKGAYNLEFLLDGTHNMDNASLASKRNKRYRKKKAVEAIRKKEEAKKPPDTNADDLLDKLITNSAPPKQNGNRKQSNMQFEEPLEDEKMNKCACCGKETLHLVRVGNNSDIGMCCEHCATVIMMELQNRRYKREERESKIDMLNTDEPYVNRDGKIIPVAALKFEVSDREGNRHTFAVSSYPSTGTTYEAKEIYKAGKNGKKLKTQPYTEYCFAEYGPKDQEQATIERLIKKTAQGVAFQTMRKDNADWVPEQIVGYAQQHYLQETGMIEIENGYFRIDGERFDGEELWDLLSLYEGFRMHYQIMDALDPVLDKNTYLMPVRLDDKTFLDELEDIILTFSENNNSRFISYKNIPGFDLFFEKYLEKLSFYFQRNPRGVGKIAGMKIIKRLREIDTDDDMFPEYHISQIQSIISEGEWFNHPEKQEV